MPCPPSLACILSPHVWPRCWWIVALPSTSYHTPHVESIGRLLKIWSRLVWWSEILVVVHHRAEGFWMWSSPSADRIGFVSTIASPIQWQGDEVEVVSADTSFNVDVAHAILWEAEGMKCLFWKSLRRQISRGLWLGSKTDPMSRLWENIPMDQDFDDNDEDTNKWPMVIIELQGLTITRLCCCRYRRCCWYWYDEGNFISPNSIACL